MRTSIAAGLALTFLAGCGTTTSEDYKRDAMPEIGVYSPTPTPWTKVRVGVMKLKDATHQTWNHSKPVGDQAGEQLETLIVRSQRFNVIERLQLDNVLKEQGLEGIVDPSELAKSGKVRGLEYIIGGAITNFRVKVTKEKTAGGIFDNIIKPIAPLSIDTSKTVVETQVGVDVKLVNTTTGEIVAKEFGEVTREDVASAWGVRVLGVGGNAKNELRIDADSQGKILRWAMDEVYKKMLPMIDAKFSQAQPSYCPNCKVELPTGQNFCTKCGKSALKPKCAKADCGMELEAGAKFCGKCGTKVDPQ